MNTLVQQSLPIFAYEVGKLIGPTIIELPARAGRH